MNNFAALLYRLRREKGFTLTDLGGKCNPPIDKTYLSKLENSKIRAGEDVIRRLSEALDIPEIAFLEAVAKDNDAKLPVDRLDSYNRKVFSPEEAKQKVLDSPMFKEVIPGSDIRESLTKSILSLDTDEANYFLSIIKLYADMKQSKLALVLPGSSTFSRNKSTV